MLQAVDMTDQQYTEAGSAISMTATRRRGRKQTVLPPVEAISVHRMDVESPARGFLATPNRVGSW